MKTCMQKQILKCIANVVTCINAREQDCHISTYLLIVRPVVISTKVVAVLAICNPWQVRTNPISRCRSGRTINWKKHISTPPYQFSRWDHVSRSWASPHALMVVETSNCLWTYDVIRMQYLLLCVAVLYIWLSVMKHFAQWPKYTFSSHISIEFTIPRNSILFP